MNDDDRPTEAMDAVFTDPDLGLDRGIPSDHDTPRDLFQPGLAHDPTVFDTRLGPGHEVGGYVIDDELGRGAFGVVYAATHPMIGKRAAIKVLKPDVSNNAGVVERFILEARAVNEIGHPNIVDIFAYGTLPDGRQYLVMDLLVGETLSSRVAREPLSLPDAVLVIDQVASALAAAHAKGIVHRDLKPDNVFLVDIPGSMVPEVKLLDFGIVKLLPSASADAAGSSRVETKTGIVLGTANYMSPEQARNRIDDRTDIYALGVMAFELLTGRLPYIHDNAIETMVAHEVDPIPSVNALAPGTPVELAQLAEAMMAKSPDDRPTLAAVRNVLKRMKSLHVPMSSAVPMRTLPGVLPAPDAARESRTALPRPPRDSSPAIRESQPVINPSARAAKPAATTAMQVKRSRRWPWILLVLLLLLGGAAAVAYFVYGWPEI